MALHSRLGCSEGRLSSVLMLVDVSVDVSVVSVVSVGLQTAKKTQKVVKVAWGVEAEAGSVQTACPGDLHGNKPGDLRSKWLGGLKPKPDLCRVLAPAASGVATPAAPDT